MIDFGIFSAFLVSVMLLHWSVSREEMYQNRRPDLLMTWIPLLTLILLVIHIVKEIIQIVAEGKEYIKSVANLADLVAYILVIICQCYYWNTGSNQYGYFVPEPDSNLQWFLLPMILMLHMILILQHLVAFSSLSFYVTMISETMWNTTPFYLVLFIFIASYTILRMFMF